MDVNRSSFLVAGGEHVCVKVQWGEGESGLQLKIKCMAVECTCVLFILRIFLYYCNYLMILFWAM